MFHDKFFKVSSIIFIASSTCFLLIINGGANLITLSPAGTLNNLFFFNHYCNLYNLITNNERNNKNIKRPPNSFMIWITFMKFNLNQIVKKNNNEKEELLYFLSNNDFISTIINNSTYKSDITINNFNELNTVQKTKIYGYIWNNFVNLQTKEFYKKSS